MNSPLTSPHLAAVILNWNHTDDTITCASQLLTWANPPQIWVADNGSKGDAIATLQRALPAARILPNQANLGFGGGNNTALAAILAQWQTTHQPAFILLLNNDAVLDEPTTHRLMQTLQAQPRIALLGTVIDDTELLHARGALASYGGKDVVRWIDMRSHHPPSPTDSATDGAANDKNIADVFYVPATAAILRTQALAEVGLLDPDYFYGVEMADWCQRARSLGWRSCIHLGTHISHDVKRSGAVRNSLHVYYNVRNRFLFLRKQPRPHKTAWVLMWIWRAAYATFTALVQGQWQRARVLLLALKDGLTGKVGIAPAWLQPK